MKPTERTVDSREILDNLIRQLAEARGMQLLPASRPSFLYRAYDRIPMPPVKGRRHVTDSFFSLHYMDRELILTRGSDFLCDDVQKEIILLRDIATDDCRSAPLAEEVRRIFKAARGSRQSIRLALSRAGLI